ncbi:MAG: nucleoside-triphosphatase [Symbiobacteriaceae bacterium]|nr:nucleoside-triphosphatase [Symbiobacteriaceae bacterium]
MHLFLTGDKGIGKSTALVRYLDTVKVRYQGIRTQIRDDPSGYRYLFGERIDNRQNPLEHFLLATRTPGGSFQTHQEGFEKNMVRLLSDLSPDCNLIVIDELGYLEDEAIAFQERVLSLLDGSRPVLGVLKKHSSLFLGSIARHHKVTVYEVNLQNRDQMPAEIASFFSFGTKT